MKVNLIIDSNNLFYGSTVLDNYAKKVGVRLPKTEKLLGSEEALNLFVDKISFDIYMLKSNIQIADDIYLIQDSSSWRKDYDKNYKRNRNAKNQEIDWGNFEKGIERLLKEQDYLIRVKVDKLEADDIICLLDNTLLKEDENALNIIASTDGDFKQLLKPRTIIYNQYYKNTRFMFSKDWNVENIKALEEKSLGGFENLYGNKKNVNDLFDVSDIKVTQKPKSIYKFIKDNFEIEYVDRWLDITSKIIRGDDKDNVLSIHTWKKPDKVVKDMVLEGKYERITPKYITKIFEEFKKQDIPIHPKSLFDNFDLVFDLLERETKQDLDKREILKNMQRNFKLLILSKKTIPQEHQETYEQKYETLLDDV